MVRSMEQKLPSLQISTISIASGKPTIGKQNLSGFLYPRLGCHKCRQKTHVLAVFDGNPVPCLSNCSIFNFALENIFLWLYLLHMSLNLQSFDDLNSQVYTTWFSKHDSWTGPFERLLIKQVISTLYITMLRFV